LEERWHYQHAKNMPNLIKLPVNEITVDQGAGITVYLSLGLFDCLVKDWKDRIRQ
jgi:hypothetical protein